MRRVLLILMMVLVVPLLISSCIHRQADVNWRTADRSSVGMAPDPATHPQAVVQIYVARAFRWRGAFAVHTWIVTKRQEAAHYTVHQVMGWHVRRGGEAISSITGIPDQHWFGNAPWLITELRGETATAAIDNIENSVRNYAYNHTYRLWPGPNSNTFVATIIREVPELKAEMPALAIGKDFLPDGKFIASPPSGSGYQLSLFGIIGLLIGQKEGLEINFLGLTLGIDPFGLAVKLPGLGRLGY